VKLFVGRLPREVTQREIRSCFEDFGEVLEVFLIDSTKNRFGCAFVRMAKLEDARECMEELHEVKALANSKEPMQVTFAKGETTRLGLDPEEESGPARGKRENDSRRGRRHEAMNSGPAALFAQLMQLPPRDLVDIVKDGQDIEGRSFDHKWQDFCDAACPGLRAYEPSKHAPHVLAHFVSSVEPRYRRAPWFRNWIRRLPPPPPAMPPFMPPVPFMGAFPPPFGAPPFMMPGFADAYGLQAGDGDSSFYEVGPAPSRRSPKPRQLRAKWKQARIINIKDSDQKEEDGSVPGVAEPPSTAGRPVLDYSGVDTICIASDDD